MFQTGILTDNVGDAYATPFGLGGIPLDSLRFLRDTETDDAKTISFDVDMELTDRLRVNFEGRSSSPTCSGIPCSVRSAPGPISTLTCLAERPTCSSSPRSGAPADYFSSGFYTYYWFGLDSREQNDGELYTPRGDVEYDISDMASSQGRASARAGPIVTAPPATPTSAPGATFRHLGRAVGAVRPGVEGRAAARCSGNPFYAWGQPGLRRAASTPACRIRNSLSRAVPTRTNSRNIRNLRDPFADNFQRGEAATPIPNGQAWFYGGDDFLADYLAGDVQEQWDEISTFSQSPERFNLGVDGRTYTDPVSGEVIACDPFCPPDISNVTEITKAAYARIDFGHDFDSGWSLGGNIGVRYVETAVSSDALVGFPQANQFDDPSIGGNGDGVVQVAEIQNLCQSPVPAGQQRLYCQLTAQRLEEFASLFTGEAITDDRDITFDHWLPSFNVRLDSGDGWVFRGAVSKGISRPDLQLFNAGGVLGFSGRVECGPLLSLDTGNRNLLPVEAWNYDLSVEWYFDVGRLLTVAGFVKDITGIVSRGTGVVNYTSPTGVSQDVIINGPANDIDGTLYGVELAYQQVYDFLPGLLSGLGSQLTYTYVNGDDFPNPLISGIGSPSVATAGAPLNGSPFVNQQPLQGISEHTLNATLFYERGPLALRAAYNWRSDFLITPRDDIFPFSPI